MKQCQKWNEIWLNLEWLNRSGYFWSNFYASLSEWNKENKKAFKNWALVTCRYFVLIIPKTLEHTQSPKDLSTPALYGVKLP